jgi:hypothetical protein
MREQYTEAVEQFLLATEKAAFAQGHFSLRK